MSAQTLDAEAAALEASGVDLGSAEDGSVMEE
jgi:hypothetical protein